MSLLAGFAQETITPSLDMPVYLAGFGRNRLAHSVHDELMVKALALVDGETKLIVVALDLLGLARTQCQQIENQIQQDIAATQLLIACTHTHHGPDTLGLWGPDEMTSGVDPIYLDFLRKRVVAVAKSTMNDLQTVVVRSGSTIVPGIAKNARDPDILDEELNCLQFTSTETQAILASWFIYPCHPETLWENNPHITADYAAALRARVEVETGAPCLVMVGALGGMMTPDVEEHSFAEANRIGERLAVAGMKTLANHPDQPVKLSYRRTEMKLPLENPLFKMAAETGLLATTFDVEETILTEASLLKLGSSWFFAVPGELLPKMGLIYRQKMKEAGASNATIIGLANDELGYILPAEEFVTPTNYLEPGASYEESMSVGPGVEPVLSKTLENLLILDSRKSL
jgi:hypothetical protein